jgi:hypothetical protein
MSSCLKIIRMFFDVGKGNFNFRLFTAVVLDGIPGERLSDSYNQPGRGRLSEIDAFEFFK